MHSPTVTYVAEAWPLKKRQKSALGVYQGNLERSRYTECQSYGPDRFRNTILRSITQISDASLTVARLK